MICSWILFFLNFNFSSPLVFLVAHSAMLSFFLSALFELFFVFSICFLFVFYLHLFLFPFLNSFPFMFHGWSWSCCVFLN